MEVIITTEETIGSLVVDQIVAMLAEKPEAVLGLATGSSPLQIYDALAQRVESGQVSFARARGFTLDEYVGLPDGHPAHYRTVIDEEFVSRVDFARGAVRGPDGTATDLTEACLDYERAMAEAGGIDLQILGIGTDGHIAFNEPGSSFASRTRVKTLTQQTRRDNARFFLGDSEAVPRHCLTQGLVAIMEARQIVLVARGKPKPKPSSTSSKAQCLRCGPRRYCSTTLGSRFWWMSMLLPGCNWPTTSGIPTHTGILLSEMGSQQ